MNDLLAALGSAHGGITITIHPGGVCLVLGYCGGEQFVGASLATVVREAGAFVFRSPRCPADTLELLRSYYDSRII